MIELFYIIKTFLIVFNDMWTLEVGGGEIVSLKLDPLNINFFFKLLHKKTKYNPKRL